MRTTILIIATAISVMITACAASDPDSIASRLKAVSLYDNNGWGGVPEEWTIQQQLDKAASNDWLYNAALNNPNPAVRAASFNLLSRRNDSRCGELLLKTLGDTARLTVIAFDVWYESCVANHNVDYSQSLPVEGAYLDSILIFTPDMGHISRLHKILPTLPPSDRYYPRIKAMAYYEGIPTALYALMRYRRSEDKAIVIESLREYAMGLDDRHVACGTKGRTNYALGAMAIWPDADFWQPLMEVCDYEMTRSHFDYPRIRLMYAALMAYDDERSLALIEKILAEASEPLRQYHIEGFNRAFRESPLERYLPIAKQYPYNFPF